MGRSAVVALVVGAAAVLLSCSSGEGTTPPSTTAPSTTTTVAPTTTLSPEQSVLAAVDGYWSTFLEANDPPNPDHPGLGTFMTGQAKAITTQNIESALASGHAIRLPSGSVTDIRPKLEELTPDRAVVIACVIDDSVRVVEATGEIVNDTVATFSTRFILVKEAGQWKVSENIGIDRWDGVAGCALGAS